MLTKCVIVTGVTEKKIRHIDTMCHCYKCEEDKETFVCVTEKKTFVTLTQCVTITGVTEKKHLSH
jgi:hypothetical protein